MPYQPSQLSLIAAGVYGLIAIACFAASAFAIYHKDKRSRAVIWAALSVFFVVLAAMRLFSLEDAVRGDLRGVMQLLDLYDQRRAWQAPIAVGLITLVTIVFASQIRNLRKAFSSRLSSTIVLAQLAVAIMTVLIGLRIVSFHAIDALLYGSFKLNWLIDLGSAALVAVCAGAYCRILTREGKTVGSRL